MSPKRGSAMRGSVRIVDVKLSIVKWALCLVVVSAAQPVHAETMYEDEDSSYLAVVSFFVEPVGQLLEWTLFRPIHVVHHWISPAETIEGRPLRECTSMRPGRDCSRQ